MNLKWRDHYPAKLVCRTWTNEQLEISNYEDLLEGRNMKTISLSYTFNQLPYKINGITLFRAIPNWYK